MIMLSWIVCQFSSNRLSMTSPKSFEDDVDGNKHDSAKLNVIFDQYFQNIIIFSQDIQHFFKDINHIPTIG